MLRAIPGGTSGPPPAAPAWGNTRQATSGVHRRRIADSVRMASFKISWAGSGHNHRFCAPEAWLSGVFRESDAMTSAANGARS